MPPETEPTATCKRLSRALANQTTADNAGLLGVAPAVAPQAAASAPVLAALATPLGPAPGKPQLATWPTIAAVIDPAEKTVITSPMVGSTVKAVTLHTSAAAVNVSRQVADWAVIGFTLDAALSASVLAKLEAQLLADLAAGVTPAADLAAALAACNPAATAIVGTMAKLVGMSATLAGLGQAGLLPRVVGHPQRNGHVGALAPRRDHRRYLRPHRHSSGAGPHRSGSGGVRVRLRGRAESASAVQVVA